MTVKIENNSVNLCDSCEKDCETCDAYDKDYLPGDCDTNICCCSKYNPLMTRKQLNDGPDNNVGTKLSTNLAEVGTDCISKQQAIDALRGYLVGKRCPDDGTLTCRLIENEVINKLPPIQSDIVRCKDCRYYDFEEKECLDLLGHGRRWEEDDFCSYAERRWRRKHESN